MRIENRMRNQDQGVNITAADVDTEVLGDGPRSPTYLYVLVARILGVHRNLKDRNITTSDGWNLN